VLGPSKARNHVILGASQASLRIGITRFFASLRMT
jgi:hypothetical protein